MKTIWQPIISWISDFRVFPCIHFANTCFVLKAVYLKTIWKQIISWILDFRIFVQARRQYLFINLFNWKTTWKPIIYWILDFRIFPSIHLVSTFENFFMFKQFEHKIFNEFLISGSFLPFTSSILVLLTVSFRKPYENQWCHESCISECFFPFTSSILFKLYFALGNKMKTNGFMILYFRIFF